MSKPGRNDPCPCGSGKKYKRCCGAGNPIPFPGSTEPPGFPLSGNGFPGGTTFMEAMGKPNAATDTLNELKRAMAGQNFATRAEAEGFVGAFMAGQNSAPLEDFLGMSPGQMHRILNATSAAEGMEGILELKPGIKREDIEAIPLLGECLALLGCLKESGPVKATAKGNLPRALVLRWWDESFGPEYEDEKIREIARPNNEEGDWKLWCARRIVREAGLIKLRGGEFSLTKTGEALLEAGALDDIYALLFEAVGWKFDWNEGRDDFRAFHPISQDAFVFNLHLLGKLTASWTEGEPLVEAYLRAFPSLRGDLPADESGRLTSYSRITIQHGLVQYPIELGLLESKGGILKGSRVPETFRVTPLFSRFLSWPGLPG